MSEVPAKIGMQMAIVQQRATLGMMKANADAQSALVNMIAQSSEQIAASGRGSIVNIAA
jgi:hypothetical protein